MIRHEVTAVMPALDEAENLAGAAANVLESYREQGIDGQLVIVDDGSRDATGALADALASRYPSVSVLHHERPRGIGASFWDGVRVAAGEAVTMIPGDGENDAAEILRYLPLLEDVDVVVPFICNRGVRSAGRRVLSALYRGIVNAGFGLSLRYTNGTVLYRRSILEDVELRSTGFFYQTELLVKTLRRGYLYAEVPCALGTRGSGASRATTWRSLRQVALGFLTTFRDVRLRPERRGVTARSATARRREECRRWGV